jgi:hypothetical protein
MLVGAGGGGRGRWLSAAAAALLLLLGAWGVWGVQGLGRPGILWRLGRLSCVDGRGSASCSPG